MTVLHEVSLLAYQFIGKNMVVRQRWRSFRYARLTDHL